MSNRWGGGERVSILLGGGELMSFIHKVKRKEYIYRYPIKSHKKKYRFNPYLLTQQLFLIRVPMKRGGSVFCLLVESELSLVAAAPAGAENRVSEERFGKIKEPFCLQNNKKVPVPISVFFFST